MNSSVDRRPQLTEWLATRPDDVANCALMVADIMGVLGEPDRG